MKEFVILLLLSGLAFTCTPYNLSAGSASITYGECAELYDANGTLVFNASGPSLLNVSLTLDPNSTSNSTSGPWGTFSASGNLTILNQTIVNQTNVINQTNISNYCNTTTLNSSLAPGQNNTQQANNVTF